jgi:hypothetical protein
MCVYTASGPVRCARVCIYVCKCVYTYVCARLCERVSAYVCAPVYELCFRANA